MWKLESESLSDTVHRKIVFELLCTLFTHTSNEVIANKINLLTYVVCRLKSVLFADKD